MPIVEHDYVVAKGTVMEATLKPTAFKTQGRHKNASRTPTSDVMTKQNIHHQDTSLQPPGIMSSKQQLPFHRHREKTNFVDG